MFGLIESLRSEVKMISRNKTRTFLIGALFVVVGLIVICFFNVPVFLGSLRILPGGGLGLFLCYLFSILFFFVSGITVSVMYSYVKCGVSYARKGITDILISYISRLFWLILFFNFGHYVISILFVITSVVFLVFSIICSVKINKISMILASLMIIDEITLLIYNIRIICVN